MRHPLRPLLVLYGASLAGFIALEYVARGAFWRIAIGLVAFVVARAIGPFGALTERELHALREWLVGKGWRPFDGVLVIQGTLHASMTPTIPRLVPRLDLRDGLPVLVPWWWHVVGGLVVASASNIVAAILQRPVRALGVPSIYDETYARNLTGWQLWRLARWARRTPGALSALDLGGVDALGALYAATKRPGDPNLMV